MLKKHDRVVLLIDLKNNGESKTPIGTVGTIREILDCTGCLVIQTDYKEKPNIIGILDSSDKLRLATLEELQLIEPHKILPNVYHKGNKYLFNGIVYTIEDIELAENEMDDIISLIDEKDKSNIKMRISIIEETASYIPIELPEFKDDKIKTDISVEDIQPNISEVESILKTTKESTIDNGNEDLIIIIIDGIQFKLLNNQLIIPNITIDKIDTMEKVLNKLKNLLTKGS